MHGAATWRSSSSRGLIALAAVLVAGAIAASVSAQAPAPPLIYDGRIESVSDVCGGGTISLETNGERTYVAAISIEGFKVSGDGETSVPLNLSSRFDPDTVPIAEGGDFEGVYFRSPFNPGLEAYVFGVVSDVQLYGWVSFSPSICGQVLFTGRLIGSPTPVSDLPRVGSGSSDHGGSGAWLPVVIAAALGTAALLLGLAARRFARQYGTR